MEPYRVFISSIMNRALEDLTTERNAARAGVEQFVPVTMTWAFEEEPASSKPLLDFYLDGVKTADLFLLILAENVTKPVQEEYRIACDYGKPMLIFCVRMSLPEKWKRRNFCAQLLSSTMRSRMPWSYGRRSGGRWASTFSS